MTEAVLEKTVCEKCGVDVREGTTFCYNCGSQVAVEPVADTVAAVSEKVVAVETETPKPTKAEKIARSAEERRKARVRGRKTIEYSWQPTDDPRWLLVFTLIISVIVIFVVVLALWK